MLSKMPLVHGTGEGSRRQIESLAELALTHLDDVSPHNRHNVRRGCRNLAENVCDATW